MQTKNFLSVFMVIILATSGPLFLPLAYVSTALGETNTATTGADTPDASPTETAPAPTPRPGPVVAVTANKAEGEAPLQVFF